MERKTKEVGAMQNRRQKVFDRGFYVVQRGLISENLIKLH